MLLIVLVEASRVSKLHTDVHTGVTGYEHSCYIITVLN